MPNTPKGKIFTVGHSTHTTERLLELLHRHRITAVADVRSNPYSRVNPQFNRETLRDSLKSSGIAYVFLGHELGARPDDPSCYLEGKVQYDLIAKTPRFKQGLERVEAGMATYQVALMCAEKDPLSCHRTILVCRYLVERGAAVEHILEDGSLESHDQALKRLRQELSLPERDLFHGPEAFVDEAYALRGQQLAFNQKQSAAEGHSLGADNEDLHDRVHQDNR